MATPSGMVEVTKDQFFAFLKADPRDIMPSVRDSERTTWETKSREVIGVSFPGWKRPGDPQSWHLTEAAARTVPAATRQAEEVPQ